jgi:Xaa-Pro aminopeptidase
MNHKNYQEFKKRRSALIEKIGDGVAVIFNAHEAIRNRDSHYPYRSDSYFHYFSGFTEPQSVLLLLGGKSPKTILFCRNKNLEMEIWNGFIYGPKEAKEVFLFDEAYDINLLDDIALKEISGHEKIYYRIGQDALNDQKINDWIKALRDKARAGVQAPQAIEDISHIADEMRLIKSDFEIDIMKRSAKIASLAHNRAMKFVKPQMYEYELEAEILHEFMSHGIRSPAYQSIVAAGKNACTLHYVDNNSKIQDGDLILIDAGCELESYASDISRTFPANGKFSKIQKDFYQLVLEAQSAALSKISSNHHWNEPHEAALSVLIEGFKDFGLCQGSHQEIYETGAYKEFYMHRTGHWLGLDVHDAGNYKTFAKEWKQFQPGMTLTVEPGCYIRPSANIPNEFWNIGIRIEDDVLVTQNGYEVLTKDSPKTIESIEALMAK